MTPGVSLTLILLAAFLQPLASLLATKGSGKWAGPLVTIWTATLFVSLAFYLPDVSQGSITRISWAWAPSIGVNLSLKLDGLAILFALIITGIGSLVFAYASHYFHRAIEYRRYYPYVTLFMAAMIGLVLSDNVLMLFVFWELTSITSYLMIGFTNPKAETRKAALQALLVTGAGGLAMLGGFILLGEAAGSYDLSVILTSGTSGLTPIKGALALCLVLIGGLTKSAQWPFHFWLPGAMAAPTPVSAYLHSATMVKAGIYLLFRLEPAFGASTTWQVVLLPVGAVTMLLGGWLAYRERDLKATLAYTTISALGTMTLLLGIGTIAAAKAAITLVLVHAIYKAALFLVVGAVDHQTGSRDVKQLGGLWRAMPMTGLAALAAGFSLAGLPPTIGFIAKELMLKAQYYYPEFTWPLTITGLVTGSFSFAVALKLVVDVFFRQVRNLDLARRLGSDDIDGKFKTTIREASPVLWSGPFILAMLGLIIGAASHLIEPLISSALEGLTGLKTAADLRLWYGFSPVLVITIFAVFLGGGLYFVQERFLRISAETETLASTVFEDGLSKLLTLARKVWAYVQSGRLIQSLYWLIGAALLICLWSTYTYGPSRIIWPDVSWPEHTSLLPFVACLIIVTSSTLLLSNKDYFTMTIALGGVGFGVAFFFLIYGGLDLALTQLSVEAIAIVILLFGLRFLPASSQLSRFKTTNRLAHLAIAGLAGSGAVLLTFLMTGPRSSYEVATQMGQASWNEGFGRNVVNVTLVDFRALDTLGEVAVLLAAAVGVSVLLQRRFRRSPRTQIRDAK